MGVITPVTPLPTVAERTAVFTLAQTQPLMCTHAAPAWISRCDCEIFVGGGDDCRENKYCMELYFAKTRLKRKNWDAHQSTR